jgi:hypothetical protein
MALIDIDDDGERGSIHLELGRIALADSRVELAARHFKEALVLDLHLEQARTLLLELGEGTLATIQAKTGPRAAVRAIFRRVRRVKGA